MGKVVCGGTCETEAKFSVGDTTYNPRTGELMKVKRDKSGQLWLSGNGWSFKIVKKRVV